MSDYLDAVDEQLAAGSTSAQALVLVYRAAEEAEERRDIGELERAIELARRLVSGAGGALEAEAERLIALCEQRLERTRTPRESFGSAATAGIPTCPGCGRPIATSAVRCRACGTLLV
jgi:hypothetical protein